MTTTATATATDEQFISETDSAQVQEQRQRQQEQQFVQGCIQDYVNTRDNINTLIESLTRRGFNQSQAIAIAGTTLQEIVVANVFMELLQFTTNASNESETESNPE